MDTRASRYAMWRLHAPPSREAAINPNPQKGGYPAPDRVTFLTGAKCDFPNWRRHARFVPKTLAADFSRRRPRARLIRHEIFTEAPGRVPPALTTWLHRFADMLRARILPSAQHSSEGGRPLSARARAFQQDLKSSDGALMASRRSARW